MVTAAALSPQRTAQFSKAVVDAGVDIFVIRGTTVSAEHVSGAAEPLNLKQFIYELDVPVIVGGCATYTAALHLMRTGAAGVLVGFGGGAAHTTRNVLGIRVPMATAVADVAAARRDYMDESGGRYVHVIADGGVGWSGDLPKAIACGADAVMMGSPLARATDAPGKGHHWGMEAVNEELPRGKKVDLGTVGTIEEVLHRPLAHPRRVDELLRRPAPRHGHHRLQRPQGVPARRGRGGGLGASAVVRTTRTWGPKRGPVTCRGDRPPFGCPERGRVVRGVGARLCSGRIRAGQRVANASVCVGAPVLWSAPFQGHGSGPPPIGARPEFQPAAYRVYWAASRKGAPMGRHRKPTRWDRIRLRAVKFRRRCILWIIRKVSGHPHET